MSKNYSLQGMDVSPFEFLSAFFTPAERVCIRVLADREGAAFSGQKLEELQGNFDEPAIIDRLNKHNIEHRGIYFVINYGGHEDGDIVRINAQFMECDKLPLKEQLAQIKAFPLEPSLIVKTRKSLHCYWLVKNGHIDRFRHIQRQLVAQFGADSACINESRVFRLPGFNHCKEDPILVKVVKFNPELRYEQDELEAVLPTIPEEVAPGTSKSYVKRGTQKGLVLTGKQCQFLQFCKKNAKTLEEPLWYAMITNLAVFENGAEAIHKLSKAYPKYTYEETQQKINHFHKTKTKPMTCAAIAERGFKCPRLNQCKCKSPAGLAFYPLDAVGLTKVLATIKPKRNPFLDIQIARQFVDDFLFNVDHSIADVFINNNLKNHFNFKIADIKGLPPYHKDLYKKFSSSQEARRERQEQSGMVLQDWYELDGNGVMRFLPSVLADYCAENENVFYCADKYYFYEHGVYERQDDNLVAEQRVRSYMHDRRKTSAQIGDAEHQWRMEVNTSVREINVNPYILNFRNGLYNVLTDEFIDHSPSVLSTIRLGGNYDPNADCPMFHKYLHDVLPASEHPLIQEVLGYLLLAVNKAKKSFMFLGDTDTGKSTMLYIIQTLLLTPENVSTLQWQKLDEKFSTIHLFGKLANIYGDLGSDALKDTSVFKSITGGDYIMGEYKHKDGFSFKPTVRLIYSLNVMPKSYNDRTDAFYKRLVIIRFANQIPEHKQDGDLWDKLKLEVDGITAWALVGLRRMMENKFKFSTTESTERELKNYKLENSTVLSFVDECCAVDPKAMVLRNDLYGAYKEYCGDNGYQPYSRTRFNRKLDALSGVTRSQDSTAGNRRVWRGLRLLS